MKNKWQSIMHRFHKLSIRQKMTMIVLLSTLLPAIVTLGRYSRKYYSMTLADTLRQNQQVIASTTPSIEKIIDQILTESRLIHNDPYFKVLFHSPETDYQKLAENREQENLFISKINSIIRDTPISHIRFYMDLPKGHPFYRQNPSLFFPMTEISGSYWHGIFAGTQLNELFCPAFYLSAREQKELGDQAYIVPIYTKDDLGHLMRCYMAMYYSSSVYEDILSQNMHSDDSVYYIITDRDAVVVTTDSELSGLYVQSYDEIYESLLSSNNFIEKKVLNETVYFSYQTIKRPNWFMIAAVPRSSILHGTLSSIGQSVFYVAITLVISLGLALMLSHSLGKRISSVIKTMSKTKEGHLVPMEEPDVQDEIGELISTYNYMTRQQERLTEDLKKTADELRIAEVNALQAQINPHFLYNTLDTIHWMALTGKTEDISTIVRNLSRFYKLTLGKDMTSTTIKNELEQVTTYVELQNIRFDHAIELIIDMPEELNHFKIPRLTLQPIVENAILHGIREKDPPEGCIIITGWFEEDASCLLISDDGIGMSQQLIPKLLTKEGIGIKTTGTNIAVYNVHHRLQLLYGEDYGLSYESTPGQGTEVKVRIPILEAE